MVRVMVRRKDVYPVDNQMFNDAVHHLDKATFDNHSFKIRCGDVVCKFTQRPKYDIQIQLPNDFNLEFGGGASTTAYSQVLQSAKRSYKNVQMYWAEAR